MARGNSIGQGIETITDPETGRIYPIQAGGAGGTVDAAVDALAAQGGEGEGGDAQPDEGVGEAQPEPEGSGQDLIEPFLEGLEGEQREIVAKRLKEAQSKWDSSANQKIQQLSEQLKGFQQFTDDPAELKPVVDLYAYIMQEPDEALPWVIEELETNYGVEGLSKKVADSLGITEGQQRADVPGGVAASQSQAGNNGQQQQASPDQPLTRQDLEKFAEEQREKQRQEAERQRKAQEAAQKLDNWTTDALKKFDLEDRIGEDSPMRKFIYQQASQLMQAGQIRNGQVAIETAVEQLKQFLDSQDPTGSGANQNGSGQREPRTANAGQGINKPDDFDPSDKKDRVNLAASLLEAASSEE